MALRVETLGGLRVLTDGADLPAISRQRLRCGLLVHVAVERRVPRERILDLLWPDRDPDRGRHALSQMLYELRQSLEGDWLGLEGEHVVASDELQADVADFVRAVEGGAEDEAASLYRGPFLESVRLADTPSFERWAETRRRHLTGLFRETQRARVSRFARAGDISSALSAARRWVLAESLDEEAVQRLIELLAQAGLRNEAIRHYEEHRARLEELGSEVLPEMRTLMEDVRAGRVGAVDGGAPGSSHAPQLGAATAVVVFPFEDMSPAGDRGYFGDGLAEETISALSRLPGLRVVPRTSAFAFRGGRVAEAAGALGVTHAVEGSVRFAGDRYRVTVRLLEAPTERELWQEQLDGALESGDVFEVQDRIAGEVSRALDEHVAGSRGESARPPRPTDPAVPARRGTSNAEAYNHYLLGRQAWFERTPADLREALRHFEAAVSADPGYPQAHAGIADVYCLLGAFDYGVLAPGDAFPRAREAAERALELDPRLSAAHAALGNVLLSWEWDFAGAEERYRTAIELDPGYSMARQWYSNLLHYVGRPDDAIREATIALELDPRSAYASSSLARHFQLLRQPQRAAEQYRHALAIDDRFVTAHLGLSLAELILGDEERALDRLANVAEGLGDVIPITLGLWGYALGASGRSQDARDVVQRLKATRAEYLPPECVAIVYLGMGELDRTVTWLRKAFEARSQGMTLLATEPILDPLRGHPGFRELMKEAGLPG